MKKIHKLEDIHIKSGNITLNIDMSRMERNLNRAQYALDSAVMTDMVKFMPMDTGQFINETKARSAAIAGSGKVVAAASPFGQFLYEGKVMVGVSSGSPWAKKYEKKVVTDRDINFYKGTHPDAQAHWFEPAKEKNIDKWVEVVAKQMGK